MLTRGSTPFRVKTAAPFCLGLAHRLKGCVWAVTTAMFVTTAAMWPITASAWAVKAVMGDVIGAVWAVTASIWAV